MIDMLILIRNLPAQMQRIIALVMCSAIAALFLGIAILLSVNLWDRKDRINQLRLERSLLDQTITRGSVSDSPVSVPNEGIVFTDGESIPIIQSRLQERLNSIAQDAGIVISSVTTVRPLEVEGARYVGIQADLEGGLVALHTVLRALETSSPPLLLRQAVIRSTNVDSRELLTEPLNLSGTITVYGAIAPKIAEGEAVRP